MKEALYLVHADVEPTLVEEWDAFHGRQYVPGVVKAGGFAGAERFRVVGPDDKPVEPPKFATVYRASGLGVVRGYLEGGEVGPMRAKLDAFIAGRRIHVHREILEENYSVDADGKAVDRSPEMPVARAVFVVRVRLESETAPAWSVWYDRDHLPRVVKAGFLRGSRYRVVDDAAGAPKFVVAYEAASLDAVRAYREGAGPGFAKEHEEAFGSKVSIDRAVWSLVG